MFCISFTNWALFRPHPKTISWTWGCFLVGRVLTCERVAERSLLFRYLYIFFRRLIAIVCPRRTRANHCQNDEDGDQVARLQMLHRHVLQVSSLSKQLNKSFINKPVWFFRIRLVKNSTIFHETWTVPITSGTDVGGRSRWQLNAPTLAFHLFAALLYPLFSHAYLWFVYED